MSSSAIARTARRRTLRVAAAALIATAGLTLTACSGSDGTGTKAAATSQSDMGKAAAESDGTGSSADAQGSSAGKQDSGTKADSGAKDGSKTNSKAGAATEQSGSAHAGTAKGASPVRTEKLPDGSKAEIYKLGSQHYRAKIVNRGAVLATMEANGRHTGLDANDMFIVLTADGRVHAWMGGGHQGPGTFKLAGGWTAKVTKVGELHYRAQISGPQGVYDTLEANQHDTGAEANGSYLVLSAGGVISAHL
ncbi:hypothetical protein [Streptomyces rimosus]|uniref:hypothetical protein n=1 Tax=Streptomyces rimosus TaxID=1927 RepID=UPI0004C6A098|nr:hypothetical protein [Streptomyces rimosus]